MKIIHRISMKETSLHSSGKTSRLQKVPNGKTKTHALQPSTNTMPITFRLGRLQCTLSSVISSSERSSYQFWLRLRSISNEPLAPFICSLEYPMTCIAVTGEHEIPYCDYILRCTVLVRNQNDCCETFVGSI
jgi:hypothetical protein